MTTRTHRYIRTLGLCALLLIAVPELRADTVLTLREAVAMAPPGAPEPPMGDGKLVTLWTASDRMARIDETRHIITRIDRNETYLVSTATGTCRVITHERGAAQAQQGARRFEATGEIRQVGPWQARGYALTPAGDDALQVRVWISDEIDVDLTAARRQIEGLVTPETDWMLGLMDLGGYPVRQESSIGPVRSWSEVVSVEEAEPPAGTYRVPSSCEPLN